MTFVEQKVALINTLYVISSTVLSCPVLFRDLLILLFNLSLKFTRGLRYNYLETSMYLLKENIYSTSGLFLICKR